MIIKTLDELEDLQGRLEEQRAFSIDTETYAILIPGKRTDARMLPRARLQMVSLCWGEPPDYDSYAIPLAVKFPGFLSTPDVVRVLQPFLEDPTVLKVLHNSNYDRYVLENHRVPMVRVYDTMVACWCQDENRPKGLKAMAPLIGRYQTQTRAVDFKNVDVLSEYAERDAVVTWELYLALEEGKSPVKPVEHMRLTPAKFQPEILSTDEDGKPEKPDYGWDPTMSRREKFFRTQEQSMLDVVLAMERRGIMLDEVKIRRAAWSIEQELEKIHGEILVTAGGHFNVASNKQLGRVLFGDFRKPWEPVEGLKVGLGIPCTSRTKTGQASVDKKTLALVQHYHPIVPLVLRHSSLTKLYDTYVNTKTGLLSYTDEANILHTSFNPVGTVTGRFSSSQPNLQNIPKRADVGAVSIRSCFRARPGYVLIDVDYSQFELRMMAIFSKDRRLMEVYQTDGDVHQMTADECHVTRSVAKTLNFGLLYGLGPSNLAMTLTVEGEPTEEMVAKQYIEAFFNTYSGVRDWRGKWIAEHKRPKPWGFGVKLITGRIRCIPDIISGSKEKRLGAERELINNTIQGSVGDWIKQAMIRCHHDRRLRKMDAHLLLQVHDELLFEVPEPLAVEAKDIITDLMIQPPDGLTQELVVPIRVNAVIGPNWKELKDDVEAEGREEGQEEEGSEAA